jgi:tight adherence protein C
VLTAIYAATTVKDPMARRVKALNERREQLKAGIVASTNKRKKLTNRNQAADRVRAILSKFKMLQDDQLKKTQQRLMQAGIRNKDLAFFIIFARFVLPVVLGISAIVLIYFVELLARVGRLPPLRDRRRNPRRKLQGARHLAQEQGHQAQPRDPQGPSRRARPAGHLRRGRAHGRRRLRASREGAGQGLSGARRRVRADRDRARLPQRAPAGVREPRQRVDLEAVRGVVTTMIQTEKYGTPLASALRVLSAEFRNERMMRAEEKAARLPAIMTIPLILFILPTLFVVILGPAACSISDNFINRRLRLTEAERNGSLARYHSRQPRTRIFATWLHSHPTNGSILALVFVLGLLVGAFLFAGGGRKWKTRYREESAARGAGGAPPRARARMGRARKGVARARQPSRRGAQGPTDGPTARMHAPTAIGTRDSAIDAPLTRRWISRLALDLREIRDPVNRVAEAHQQVEPSGAGAGSSTLTVTVSKMRRSARAALRARPSPQ